MAVAVDALDKITFGVVNPKTQKLELSWDDAVQLCLELARQIIERCQETGEVFDKVLTIPRGGLFPTNIIVREIGCRGIDILQACLSSYDVGATKRNTKFKFGQLPGKELVESKNVLIIDEVCESGFTLTELYRILKDMDVGLLRCAVLHYKPGKSQTGFVPDFYVDTTNRWIEYPWEVNEQNGNNLQMPVMRPKP